MIGNRLYITIGAGLYRPVLVFNRTTVLTAVKTDYAMAINRRIFISSVIGMLFVFHSLAGMDGSKHYFYMSDVSSINGLSHSHVKTIFKDSRGFLWFGTFDGLNRFDGYSCKRYLYDKSGSSQYQNKIVYSILEDGEGFLWIAASGTEVLRFDPVNESFTALPIPLDDLGASALSFHVYDLVRDEQGTLWFATSRGLFFLEPDSHRIQVFTQNVIPESAEIETFSFDSGGRLWIGTKGQGLYMKDGDDLMRILPDKITSFITDIYIDPHDNLWIATAGGGLFNYMHENGDYKQFLVKQLPEGAIPNLVNNILPYHNSGFYIATYSGIYFFDIDKETFSDFSSELSFPRYPQNLSFNSLYLDERNVLWAATQSLGVYKYYLFHDSFSHIVPFPDDKDHPGNVIHSLVEAGTGKLLIGSEAGLILFDENDNRTEMLYAASKVSDPFMITKILHLSPDSLLVGTWNHGVWIFNPGKSQLDRPGIFRDGTAYSQVFDIFLDSRNKIWVGLHEEGLLKLNRKLEKESHYIRNGPDRQISGISVRRILEDSSGNIWIGTLGEGLDIMNSETGEYRNIYNDYITRSEISNNDILCLMEDSRGNIWIGTNGGGVNLYLAGTSEFIHLTEKDGLINDVVFSIMEDEGNNIWLQTNRGISRLSFYSGITLPVSDIRDFGIEDGLPTTDFLFSNSYISEEGKFYMPSRRGLISFFPDSLIISDIPPEIVITGIEINNKPLSEYSKEIRLFPEVRNVSLLETVILRHHLNRLSFEFAALDFFKPSDNQYMVKLEGFDDDWISLGNNRMISYINLPHGNYRLNVRAANSQNIWNLSGINLEIVITPPWWLTWWAVLIYVFLAIFVFALTRYLIIKKERLKAKSKIERMELEKELELDKFKLDFFTKITHEIRTPITMIMGPVEKMLQERGGEDSDHKYLQILKSNSEKLYQLTNQVLDLRKIDESKFTVNKVSDDLIPFLHSVVQRFIPFAESKEIVLSFNPRARSLCWNFDPAVIDRIISNLIGNAIKFTGEGGEIRVECYLRAEPHLTHRLVLEIYDNGKGIAEKEINEIFKPFYQAKLSKDSDIPGTGIGLALVKELTDLHEGLIEVESKVGEGSLFRLCFKNDLDQVSFKDEKPLSPVKVPRDSQNAVEHAAVSSCKDDKTRILIVEDNPELNDFLQSILNDHYKVFSFNNGSEGLEKARQLLPDLIISDVMMPEMNGIEMCQILKNDILTCHIPVVLLTVLSDETSQITGFEAGADDYITKPFNPSILLMKVRNILALQNNMREQFAKTFMLVPAGDQGEMDPIIDKLVAFIADNIDDPHLNIQKLQREIGIGRSQLFLKIKNVTGMTVTEMIQGLRLKKAYEYLASGKYIVSETAYMVGFKNLSHFSRLFKSHFGQSPSEIAPKHKAL